MDTRSLLRLSYLDLIFLHRNKMYGGYALRLKYPDRMRRAGIALLMASVVIVVYSLLPSKAASLKTVVKPLDTSTVTLCNIKDVQRLKIVLPPPPKANPDIKTERFNMAEIVKDNMVRPDEMLATQDELKDAVASNLKLDGENGSLESAHLLKDAPISSTASVVESSNIGTSTTPFVVVDQMPEFPGGEAALMRFLQENLRYPEAALKADQQGKVHVKFVVNEDGHVSDIKIVRSFGFGSDEEARRVVAAMPVWQPGRNNGKAVRVWFQLPIVFSLNG